MVEGRGSRSTQWLAVSCNNEGEILSVLADDFGIARTGVTLSALVDEGSVRKAEQFIAAVRSKGFTAGCELDVPAGGVVRSLTFAGMRGDTLLILASPVSPAMSHDVYDELSRLNNELINRERELARKSASLERLSAEKSRLLAIAAHDLRNPLTIISSYADLLRSSDLSDDEERLFIDEISQSSRFMAELVEELLDSARVESGHVDVDLQDLDLVNAAAHASTINRLRADRKQITLTFEALTDRAMIRADPVKLRQIINNLVVNAIKFSRSNTNVTIRVRRDGDRAVVEVEDQGIGIPRDKLAAIFEPFSTLSSFGTGGEKSTGLGLAIVKQLTHLHHAAIDVESDEGRGSVFRVIFPLSGTN